MSDTNKKELLNSYKTSLLRITQKEACYDLIDFSNRDEERDYILNKTKKYDISEKLLQNDNHDDDGIIVITEDAYYAVSPIFIHSDAFKKMMNFIHEKNYSSRYDIEEFAEMGNILIRVVNTRGIVGFDSYIPEKINDYQLSMLERIIKELNSVYKELEIYDDRNAQNIKYGMKIIQDSIKQNVKIKHL